MEKRKLAKLTLALLVFCAISGCSQSEVKNNTMSSTAAQQGQLETDPRIVTWLATCQANGEEPQIQGLLLQATAAKSIREHVKEKYGDIKAQQFCQYFGSPEFIDFARKILGKPVSITTESSSAEALAKNHAPYTVVIYPQGDDPNRYSCDLVGADGKLGAGSSDRIEP